MRGIWINRSVGFGLGLMLLAALSTGCREKWGSAPKIGAAKVAAAEPTEPSSTPKAATAQPAATPAGTQAPAKATASSKSPQPRQAAKPIITSYSGKVPPVLLSAQHAALCTVEVGDAFPPIELPQIGGGQTQLATLVGKQATAVLFWRPDHWMCRTALADIAKDVKADANIAVVGIIEGQALDAAQAEIAKSGAKFTQLADADGSAFAEVGAEALPRIYVLDREQKIAWFDIEYSEATRRELQQTLTALASAK
jgi:peroxiredoxin